MSDNIKHLIELASKKITKEKTKNFEANQECLDFINDLKIEAGNDKVPNSIIYFFYKKWNTGYKRMNTVQFFRNFKKCFNSYAAQDVRGYYLNGNSFNFSTEDRLKYEEEQYKKRQENKKKYVRPKWAKSQLKEDKKSES